MISEVVVEDNHEVKVARVLLKFNTPIRKYPEFGTWCYLINAGDSVVVFDTGPMYDAFRPVFRKFSKKLDNDDIIMQALEKYYPGKTVREILFSHFHYDHSELAPELQEHIQKKYGNLPPIRLHKLDFGSKKLMRIEQGLDKLYKKAGFENWQIGNFLKNGEKIKGTDFQVIHLPGHTEGTIGLISQKDKIIICGWWVEKIEQRSLGFALRILNESNKKLKRTVEKITLEGYNYYYYHPKIEKKKRVLMFIKKILKKKISVFCSSSDDIDEKYKKVTEKLAKELAVRNSKIIFGGQDSGLMKILADTVIHNKGKLISVHIKKQKDAYTKSKTVTVRNVNARKKYLIRKPDIIICLPGGFGTLEELQDSISLKQQNLIKKPILILNIEGFFDPLLDMYKRIIKEKFAKDQKTYEVFSDIEELVNYLDSIQ